MPLNSALGAWRVGSLAGATGAAENRVNGYMDSFSQWTYAKTAFDKWAIEFARRFTILRNA